MYLCKLQGDDSKGTIISSADTSGTEPDDILREFGIPPSGVNKLFHIFLQFSFSLFFSVLLLSDVSLNLMLLS